MRFFGYNVSDNISLSKGLTCIFGIGKSSAFQLCKELGLSPNIELHMLTDIHIQDIQRWIENSRLIELDLKKKTEDSLRLLYSIPAYKGFRHRAGLPVRGQRTHSNAKTQKNRRALRFLTTEKQKK